MTNEEKLSEKLCDYMEWNTHLEETNEQLQMRVRQLEIDLNNMTMRRRCGLYDYIGKVFQMYYERYEDEIDIAFETAFNVLQDAYDKTYWDMDKVEYNTAIKEVLYDDWQLILTCPYNEQNNCRIVDWHNIWIVVETDLIKHYKAFGGWNGEDKFIVMDDVKCTKFEDYNDALNYIKKQPTRTACQLFTYENDYDEIDDEEYFTAAVEMMDDWTLVENYWKDKVKEVEKSMKIVEDFIFRQSNDTKYRVGRICFDARLKADDLY